MDSRNCRPRLCIGWELRARKYGTCGRKIPVRQVEDGHVPLQVVNARIGGDADDGIDSSPMPDRTTKRILVWPYRVGSLFRQDDDPRIPLNRVIKVTTCKERNSHDPEVTRTDKPAGLPSVLALRYRAICSYQAIHVHISGQGMTLVIAADLHAWQGTQLIEGAIDHHVARNAPFVSSRIGGHTLPAEYLGLLKSARAMATCCGLKSRSCVSKCEKLRVISPVTASRVTLQATSRATSSLRVRTACLLIESRVEFDWRAVCGVTRRDRSAGRIPNPSEVKTESPRAKASIGKLRWTSFKRGRTAANCNEQLFSENSKDNSPQTTTQAQKHVFRQHTLEKPSSSCAKSRPESRFVIASHAPRKLQVCEIYARHEQYARDSGQQKPERLADASSNLMRKWRDNNAEMNGEVIGGSRGLLDSVQFALRLPN